jgi:hypothetical protein
VDATTLVLHRAIHRALGAMLAAYGRWITVKGNERTDDKEAAAATS